MASQRLNETPDMTSLLDYGDSLGSQQSSVAAGSSVTAAGVEGSFDFRRSGRDSGLGGSLAVSA